MNDIDNLEKEIKKLKYDFEIEKSNIRVNYMLNIFAVLIFLISDRFYNIKIFHTVINKDYITIFVILLFILFFIKDIIVYSKHFIKKYMIGVKK